MIYVVTLESEAANDPACQCSTRLFTLYAFRNIQDNEERDSPPNILASPG
jgi:hypothetical protein